MPILIATTIVTAIGLILAIMLVIAAKLLKVSVDEKFKSEFCENLYKNTPVRYLTRLMPKALW